MSKSDCELVVDKSPSYPAEYTSGFRSMPKNDYVFISEEQKYGMLSPVSTSSSGDDITRMLPLIDISKSAVKYIAVIGGSMSGLGKGVTVCSIGSIMSNFGLRVTAIKIDPYLNRDAGTMSPYEHGEVFVLEDGGEADLDLGNYERSFGGTLTSDHNVTTGKIYDVVLRDERMGTYLGKTVQIVPHVTDAIQKWISDVATTPDSQGHLADICLIEVGGTVGDLESGIYLEALQQFEAKVGSENFCICHLSYIPTLGAMNEQKTKLAQHSAKELFRCGLHPELIFCRCEHPLKDSSKQKVSLFSQVPIGNVISMHDVEDMNEVTLIFNEQQVGQKLCKRLGILPPEQAFRVQNLLVTPSLSDWQYLVDRRRKCQGTVTIAIVGKYTGLADTYLSVLKALEHATLEALVKLRINWVESSDLEPPVQESEELLRRYKRAWRLLKEADGVVCPGGFGDRGIKGKAWSAFHCRTREIPYLGICLGMQTAMLEFAANVLHLPNPDSEEFDPDAQHLVVISMPVHTNGPMGGTMRLGKYVTRIHDKDSLAYKLYDQSEEVHERHRHRYEVNPEYISQFEANGMLFVGRDETKRRMEIAEIRGHKYFMCVQYHPEFTSKPLRPNPLFLGLVLASSRQLEARFNKYKDCLCPGADLNSR